MAKVIISIGIPGSGKTAVLKKFAEKYGYNYVCPDDIRVELSGSAADQSKNSEVWSVARQRMKDGLSIGDTVVFDATFATPEGRKRFLDFAKESGAEKVQGIFFNTPLEVAKERNLKRERQVPEHVLERMDGILRADEPRLEEGLDSIFTLDEYQKLVTVERRTEDGEIKRELKSR